MVVVITTDDHSAIKQADYRAGELRGRQGLEEMLAAAVRRKNFDQIVRWPLAEAANDHGHVACQSSQNSHSGPNRVIQRDSFPSVPYEDTKTPGQLFC